VIEESTEDFTTESTAGTEGTEDLGTGITLRT